MDLLSGVPADRSGFGCSRWNSSQNPPLLLGKTSPEVYPLVKAQAVVLPWIRQLLPPSGLKGQARVGGLGVVCDGDSYGYMHGERKSEDRLPQVAFSLFIKNRPKHFMYHTKVSFAGGSHGKDWTRSTDFPPPLRGTGSQEQ